MLSMTYHIQNHANIMIKWLMVFAYTNIEKVMDLNEFTYVLEIQ